MNELVRIFLYAFEFRRFTLGKIVLFTKLLCPIPGSVANDYGSRLGGIRQLSHRVKVMSHKQVAVRQQFILSRTVKKARAFHPQVIMVSGNLFRARGDYIRGCL